MPWICWAWPGGQRGCWLPALVKRARADPSALRGGDTHGTGLWLTAPGSGSTDHCPKTRVCMCAWVRRRSLRHRRRPTCCKMSSQEPGETGLKCSLHHTDVQMSPDRSPPGGSPPVTSMSSGGLRGETGRLCDDFGRVSDPVGAQHLCPRSFATQTSRLGKSFPLAVCFLTADVWTSGTLIAPSSHDWRMVSPTLCLTTCPFTAGRRFLLREYTLFAIPQCQPTTRAQNRSTLEQTRAETPGHRGGLTGNGVGPSRHAGRVQEAERAQ